MNDCDDDRFDPRLEALFRREHSHLPAEQFAGAVLEAIAAERKRAVLVRRVVQVVAVVVVIVLLPQLVGVSGRLTTGLDAVFAFASSWLATPLGMTSAAVAGLAVVATKWARVW